MGWERALWARVRRLILLRLKLCVNISNYWHNFYSSLSSQSILQSVYIFCCCVKSGSFIAGQRLGREPPAPHPHSPHLHTPGLKYWNFGFYMPVEKTASVEAGQPYRPSDFGIKFRMKISLCKHRLKNAFIVNLPCVIVSWFISTFEARLGFRTLI